MDPQIRMLLESVFEASENGMNEHVVVRLGDMH